MTRPSSTPALRYGVRSGADCDDAFRSEMRRLFNEHYGIWGDGAPAGRRGQRVTFSERQIADLLKPAESQVYFARASGELIAYAVAIRLAAARGPISWVTQLVVHSDHRHRGVASTILGSAWCFSDDYAWGLASANPFAVRSLEKATLRACDPHVIAGELGDLVQVLPYAAGYLDAPSSADGSGARIDTRFFLDHEEVEHSIAAVSAETDWKLGSLRPGEEWLAATFRSQPRRPLTPEDLARLSYGGGSIAAQAYDRMAEGAAAQPHRWMRDTGSEVDAILAETGLERGAAILDLGCGGGRHAVELARRGYRVTGIDRSPAWLRQARALVEGSGAEVRLLERDARGLDLGEAYDAVICLYDVVGSFAREADNVAILKAIARHLAPAGWFCLSVMNRVVAEKLAILKGDLGSHPEIAQDLRPSRTMQSTGAIWDPEHYAADTTTGLVYRLERFDAGLDLPIELLVGDRRYSPSEIDSMCEASGLRPSLIRPVALGGWSRTLAPDDPRAKELLCIGRAGDRC